jgi:hypothetical protein
VVDDGLAFGGEVDVVCLQIPGWPARHRPWPVPTVNVAVNADLSPG